MVSPAAPPETAVSGVSFFHPARFGKPERAAEPSGMGGPIFLCRVRDGDSKGFFRDCAPAQAGAQPDEQRSRLLPAQEHSGLKDGTERGDWPPAPPAPDGHGIIVSDME